MPKYQVQDSESGKTLLLEGDSPPTDAELTELFKPYQKATTTTGTEPPAVPQSQNDIPYGQPQEAPPTFNPNAAQVGINAALGITDAIRSITENPAVAEASAMGQKQGQNERLKAKYAQEKAQLQQEAEAGRKKLQALNIATGAVEPLTPAGLLNQPSRAVGLPDPFQAGKPILHIPELPLADALRAKGIPITKEEEKGTGPVAGVSRLITGTLEGLTTPEMLLTAPFAGESAVIRTLFGYEMLKSQPEAIQHAGEVMRDPESTTADKIEALGHPLVSAYFTRHLLKTPDLLPYAPAFELAQAINKAAKQDFTPKPDSYNALILGNQTATQGGIALPLPTDIQQREQGLAEAQKRVYDKLSPEKKAAYDQAEFSAQKLVDANAPLTAAVVKESLTTTPPFEVKSPEESPILAAPEETVSTPIAPVLPEAPKPSVEPITPETKGVQDASQIPSAVPLSGNTPAEPVEKVAEGVPKEVLGTAEAGKAEEVAATPEHTDTINRIVEEYSAQESSRGDTIVQRNELKGTDGKWYSGGGFPSGVEMTGEKRPYWVRQTKQGTTVGKRYSSQAEGESALASEKQARADEFRSELEKMPDDRIQSQAEYWLKEKPQPSTEVKPPKEKSEPQQKSLGTGNPENDAKLEQYRKMKRSRAPMTAMQEQALEMYEAQAKADPSKWSIGDGVGWRVDRQINRGFRVAEIDTESKLAKVIPVADTGLTITGGGMEGIGPEWVHVADLVRDKKYDKTTTEETPTTPAQQPTVESVPEGGGGEAKPQTPQQALEEFQRIVREDTDLADEMGRKVNPALLAGSKSTSKAGKKRYAEAVKRFEEIKARKAEIAARIAEIRPLARKAQPESKPTKPAEPKPAQEVEAAKTPADISMLRAQGALAGRNEGVVDIVNAAQEIKFKAQEDATKRLLSMSREDLEKLSEWDLDSLLADITRGPGNFRWDKKSYVDRLIQEKSKLSKTEPTTPKTRNALRVKADNRPPDIIDDILEIGPINVKSTMRKGHEGYYGENFSAVYQGSKGIKGLWKANGLGPDDVVQALRDQGKVNQNFTVDDLWDAIEKGSKSRKAYAAGETPEARTDAFWKAVDPDAPRKGKQKEIINSGDLKTGETITVNGEELTVDSVDTDTNEVYVRGGKKYDRQRIPDGTRIAIDKGSHTKLSEAETEWTVPEAETEPLKAPIEESRKQPWEMTKDEFENGPPIKQGFVRLWRGESVNPNPKPEGLEDRWFSTSRETADFFAANIAGGKSRIVYVDIPTEDLPKYDVYNVLPESEWPPIPDEQAYVLPRDVANTRKHWVDFELHGEKVAEAIDQGKPVPAAVLKDYPDLKKEKPPTPTPKSGGELFGAEETPFNLTGETAAAPTKPTEAPKSAEELAQTEMFAIQKVVASADPVKSADAAQEMYGSAGDAAKKLENQLRVLDSDPKTKKDFSKEQRDRLKEVLALLRQREGQEGAKPVGPGTGEGPGSPTGKQGPDTGTGGFQDQSGRDIYGIAQRVREQRAKAGQVAPIPTGQGVSREDAVKWGQDLIAMGVNPEQSMKNFEATRAISFDLMAMARGHGETLAKAASNIEQKFGTNSPEHLIAKKALYDWDTRIKDMQTEWHKIGQAQQGQTDIDTGSFTGLERAYQDITGKDFSESQAKQAEQIAKGVNEADTKEETAKSKLQTEIDQIGEPIEPAIRRLADKIIKAMDERADAALKRIKARQAEGRLFTGVDPTELADLAIYGAAKITKGVVEFGAWSAEMISEIGEAIRPYLKEVYDAALKDEDTQTTKLAGGPANAEKVKQTRVSRTPKAPPTVEEQRKVFQDYKSGTPMSNDQLRTLWDRAKVYIDKAQDTGDKMPDVVNKTSADLGIPVKDVLRGLNQSRTIKRVADDVWARQKQARLLKQAARRWVETAQKTWMQKAIPTAARLAFSSKVALHGTVALGTHAPLVAATNPIIFKNNFGKMYHMVGSRQFYEIEMDKLTRRNNYTTAQRAGLVNDPSKMEDFNDPILAQSFPKLAEFFRQKLGRFAGLQGMGTRGYAVLKTLRQDLFDEHWDKLPDSMKYEADGKTVSVKGSELAKAIADTVNHITGVTGTKLPDTLNLALFAPKLLYSRLQVMGGDPWRAAQSLAHLKNLTPEEKWFATNQVKEKAKIFGVAMGLMIANQQLNNLLGDKKKLNGVPEFLGGAGMNPMESDFMKFRVAGMNVAWGSPFLTLGRLPLRLIQIGMSDGGKMKFIVYPDESMYKTVGSYARTQTSPFLSPILSLLMKGDYENRPLPQIPGYGTPPPVPKRLAAKGVKPYTWPEFISQTILPIPFQEGAKEVWHYGLGMDEEHMKPLLKGFIITSLMAATGGRIQEDWDKQENTVGPKPKTPTSVANPKLPR